MLLQCGTNDVYFQKPFKPNSTHEEDPFPLELAKRMNGLLDAVFASSPDTTVLLSSVTHINSTRCEHYVFGACPVGMNDRIIAFNKLIPEHVVAVQNAKSSKNPSGRERVLGACCLNHRAEHTSS